ncbi:MAG: 4-chlorobenzoate--CoA ligase, partial [Firmicutes bacterium HGW-Firmicutes-13]
RENWYFTGDLGYLDGEGNLHLVGRVDDMIISGGENIYPKEVEDVLQAHPQVKEAAVVGLPDKRWGEIVAAFIVPYSNQLNQQTLERFCLESPHLARYKRPRKFFFVQQIPKSPAGKILYSLLKKRADSF